MWQRAPLSSAEWTAVSEVACRENPGDPGAAGGALFGKRVPGDGGDGPLGDGVRGLQWRCGSQVIWGRRYLRENVKGEEGQPGLLKEGDKNPLGAEQHALRF